jgi:hypothetical protein
VPSLLTSLAILSTLLVPVYALIYRNRKAYHPYRILMNNFIIQFCMLSHYLILHGGFKKSSANMMYAASAITVLVSVYYLLFPFQTIKINVVPVTLQNSLLIILAMMNIWQMMKGHDELYAYPKFWFVAGILFHFSVGFALLASSEIFIDQTSPVRVYSWFLYAILNIVTNAIYIYAIRCILVRARKYSMR